MPNLNDVLAALSKKMVELEQRNAKLTTAHNQLAVLHAGLEAQHRQLRAEHATLINRVGATFEAVEKERLELKARLQIAPTYHPDQPSEWGPSNQPLTPTYPAVGIPKPQASSVPTSIARGFPSVVKPVATDYDMSGETDADWTDA